jgi:hypothetical protein
MVQTARNKEIYLAAIGILQPARHYEALKRLVQE